MKVQKRVCIVVLGDIGRSPRMQYHGLSFAKEGFIVDIVGYNGSQPIQALLCHPNVELHHVPVTPNLQKYNWLPRLCTYVSKVIFQSLLLLTTLLWLRKPNYLLVQNPPAIPTLGVCWFYARLRGCQLVIDWHNYGYTILRLTLGENNALVRMSYWIEKYFGRKADGNICVTKAMKKNLEDEWRIIATTNYDRPADMFHPITLDEKHNLFMRLSQKYPLFKTTGQNMNVFTECFADGRVVLREDRPALLVSSTSWTEDEDFSMLLCALEEYEVARSVFPSHYPPLICVITGKGPLKEYYCEQIGLKEWQHIEVCTPWLEPEDYPKLLASADLGVCLHTSSSGLDLPMKVIDMYGTGLPVCALRFTCLNELVQHDVNGLVFEDAHELAVQIQDWFRWFPKEINAEKHKIFKDNIESFQKLRWHESWKLHALPLFR